MVRGANWSKAECLVFAEGCRDRIAIIKGKFTPTLTQKDKDRCWEEIAEK
jgi:hypothetical protein